MGNKIIFFSIIILILVIGSYYANRPDPISVTSYTVIKGNVKSSVSNTRVGTIKACRRAYLAPSTGGNVAKLFVKEGDKVKLGQLLLEVWNDDLKAQLSIHHAQIKSNKATAKQLCELAAGAHRDAQRLMRLKKTDNIVSEEQVDRARTSAKAKSFSCKASKAMTEVTEANLVLVNATIERTLIRAPFDGVVAEINAELGEFVTPSPPGIPTLPPIDLLDISCLTVSAPIDEVDAPKLNKGMTACVRLDAFEQPRCSGKVTRIAPYVLEKEKQARTVEVEVTLSDEKDLRDLLPGYSADIEVLVSRKVDTLRVPTEAVLEGNQVLLITKEGLLESRQFTPGLSNWNFIEILSGLSENDTIVLSVGRDGVKTGVSVRVEK